MLGETIGAGGYAGGAMIVGACWLSGARLLGRSACGGLRNSSTQVVGSVSEAAEQMPESESTPIAMTHKDNGGMGSPLWTPPVRTNPSPLWSNPGLSLFGVVGPSGAVAAESALDVIETIDELVP